jgi:hypothetical protein
MTIALMDEPQTAARDEPRAKGGAGVTRILKNAVHDKN